MPERGMKKGKQGRVGAAASFRKRLTKDERGMGEPGRAGFAGICTTGAGRSRDLRGRAELLSLRQSCMGQQHEDHQPLGLSRSFGNSIVWTHMEQKWSVDTNLQMMLTRGPLIRIHTLMDPHGYEF